MKKTLLCLLSICVSLIAFSQNNISHGFYKLEKQARYAAIHSFIHKIKEKQAWQKSGSTEKLNMEVEQNWDGINWTEEYRAFYYYNDNTGLVERYQSEYFEEGVWFKSDKTVFTYDASNQLKTTVYSYWDENTQAFELDYKNELSYENNILTEDAEFVWDSNEMNWRPYALTTYHVSNGLVTQKIQAYEQNNDGILIPQAKMDYVYDEQLNIETIYEFRNFQQTEVPQWDSAFKYFYSYNAGLLNSIIEEGFDGIEFVNQSKVEFTFQNGVISDAKSYLYDYLNSEFYSDPSSTNDVSFNTNGSPSSQISEDEYAVSTETYLYDDNKPINNLLTPPLAWLAPYLTIFIADFEYSYSNQIASAPTETVYEYLDKNTNETSKYKVVLHYGLGEVNVNTLANPELLKLYPNPSNGQVVISSQQKGTFKVYSHLGQEVGTFNVYAGEKNTVDLTDLPKGLYYYTFTPILNNSLLITRKLILN